MSRNTFSLFYFALQPFGKVERKRDLEDTKGRGFFSFGFKDVGSIKLSALLESYQKCHPESSTLLLSP